MDQARSWLEEGNAIGKQSQPDPSKLGSKNEIACKAIEYLKKIQKSLPPPTNEDLVSVAVDDMKILSALMKLVVVYGIYTHLNDNEMISLENRVPYLRLPAKEVITTTTTSGSSGSRSSSSSSSDFLVRLSAQIVSITDQNDDVSRLILISPFIIDILSLTQRYPEDFNAVVSKIPTFNLYKLLIQLRSAPKCWPIVALTLTEMPLRRKDAVRTMIELIIEPNDGESDEIELSSLDKAVLAFTSLAPGIPAKDYIEALGTQLFSILSISNPSGNSAKLIEATVLIVEQISIRQPRILGRLRNLIVNPFLQPHQQSIENSLGAILHLNTYTGPTSHIFITHIASRVLLSLWLLVCSMGESGSIENSIIAVTVGCLENSSKFSATLVTNLLINSLPGNLVWSVKKGSAPVLLETINSTSENLGSNTGLLTHITKRTNYFMMLVKQASDQAAGQILLSLLRFYIAKDTHVSPMEKLLVAKIIESLAQDPEIKQKLFSSPNEIIEFTFSLVSARVSSYERNQSSMGTANNLNNSLKLNNLSIADSDDEDEEEEDEDEEVHEQKRTMNNQAEQMDEDNNILEVALSLLGTALMEAVAASNDASNQVSQSQKHELRLLATSEEFPSTIRARADFCYELVNGSSRTRNEVDMSDNKAVLEAAYEALKEPLVPSRAYGLHLISKLVSRNAIALETAMGIYGSQLGDGDSYVYLNAIKGIEDAAKTHSASEVIDLILPLVESKSQNEHVDKTLRAREALIRLLSPGSVDKVSSRLIELLLTDLTAKARENKDIRFRLSSASLLGIVIAEFPLSVNPILQNEAADCALGILRYERSTDDNSLRRAAAVLSLEIVNAVNEGVFQGIPNHTLTSLALETRNIMESTDDETLKDHIRAVLTSLEPII